MTSSLFKPASLLITGNEVLNAKTQDTNSPFLSKALKKLSLSLKLTNYCGDSEIDIIDSLSYLSTKSEVIFVTGGLGPTSDDLTAACVAKFFDLPLEFNQEAWENCKEAFKALGRSTIAESNKKQALLPKGCKLLANHYGTASGFFVSGVKHGKEVTIYCLPGVPFEMEPMFLHGVVPLLLQTKMPPLSCCWQVFLVGESAMQTSMQTHEENLKKNYPKAHISYQAHPGYVTYSVSLTPESLSEKNQFNDYLEQNFCKEFENNFAEFILYRNEKSLAQHIVDELLSCSFTLSIAESQCAGVLASEFSTCENFTKVLKGAVVTPCLAIKQSLLGVNNLQEEQEAIAAQMAQGALQLFGSDIALAENAEVFLQQKSTNLSAGNSQVPVRAFLAIAFLKTKYSPFTLENIEARLAKFGWQKQSVESEFFVTFTHQQKLSHRFALKQNRVKIFLLASLAAVVQYTHRYPEQ
ncbi:MAG: CinA family protein [Silvanigrellaceae bacterium]|nr:CinA family protein [Silvanigrellaceae bacterium]